MKRAAITAVLIALIAGPEGPAYGIADGGRNVGRGFSLGVLQSDPRAGFHSTIDPAIESLWSGYDTKAAMDHVRFISQYWRLAGNPGYNATVDRIRGRLTAAGLKVSVEEYDPGGRAWDLSGYSVSVVRTGAPDEVVLSREKDRLALCINSFSTPAGGIVAPLIDVGRGDRDEDYAGKSVKGAVVLGDADTGQLWRRAVAGLGAAGVISTSLPQYLNVDPPGAKPTPRDEWDILQWSSVPYDEAPKSFGFKASPRAAATLRKRLAVAGPAGVSLRVSIASSFTTGPTRTLVAEIPGMSLPAERIVMAAHIQEPGANDNASGVATLAELAASLSAAIKAKKIAAPARTLTFLFLNEISGSRRWLQDHPTDAKLVKYMFSLDMTGEDIAKTGGTFLIERYPDPGAVWDRPWDPHSEWGRGNVRAESLKGDLINDAHFAVVQRVARKSKWVVKTNPYEGGSDHTVFQQAGIPSLLDWHFTDRYYHTNFDTPDKTSPEEMRNVGVAVGATAWLLASSGENTALDVARVVAASGRDRLAIEEREGGKLAAAASDSAATKAREATILAAWKKWYGEAVRSSARLLAGAPTTEFTGEIEKLAAGFDPPRSAGGAPPLFGLGALAGLQIQQRPVTTGEYVRPPVEAFTCGTDQLLNSPIPLRATTLILTGDGRLYTPCQELRMQHTVFHREVREATLIAQGVRSLVAEERWRTAQVIARMPGLMNVELTTFGAGTSTMTATAVLEDNLGDLVKVTAITPACTTETQLFNAMMDPRRWQPGRLFHMLADPSPDIQREAAYAIGSRLSVGGRAEDLYTAAFNELKVCVLRENVKTTDDVRGLLLEAIGLAAYATEAQRYAAEEFLILQAQGGQQRLLGATRGLEALIRQNPRRPIRPETRVRLRELAVHGQKGENVSDSSTTIRMLAVQALMLAGDTDIFMIRRASSDADWQVRRLVASRLDLSNPDYAAIGEILAVDSAFQVRYDLVSAVSRHVTNTKSCEPLMPFLKDISPTVVLRAIDVIPATCADIERVIPILEEMVERLEKVTEVVAASSWHVPTRALTALARVKPELVKKRLPGAAKNAIWQVRVAAVAVAVVLEDNETVELLAKDQVPNVQTAALEALFRTKNPAVVPCALAILQTGSDFQVLMTAARVLRGLPAEAKNDATEILLAALRGLTTDASDMSRDPRVAILERLGETMIPERSTDLLPYTADFDDEVIAAAVKAFTSVVGTPPPEVINKRRRYPELPQEAQLQLQNLPKTADIHLDEGTVQIWFDLNVAPVTVAKFALLVRQGRYNGRPFHRVVPNFVVQGGSQGANEYSGVMRRFMRDEVGPQARHVRGAIGISTRGPDTGDGQIFIDLVDLPRLDRHYTVFAYVSHGMEHVDKMLEGARIKSIILDPRR